MRLHEILMAGAMVMAAIFTQSCESRQHSILRENGYITDHQDRLEKVPHYWDQVPYAQADGETLTLDVSAPEGDGPFPAVMIIHGGGWELHTNTVMEGMARYITNRGYVVFNINYRVRPDVPMEKIVEDCMGALLWVKEHAAEYKGDPKRIAVTGDSAGGHLTAMIVTQGQNPAFHPTYPGNGKTDLAITCAAPSYGVYDFTTFAKVPSIGKRYLGAAYKQNPERYKLLSPIFHVRKDLVPQLIIVGDVDPLYSANTAYVEAVKAAGAPVELWVYNGQTHAFLNDFWNEKGTKGYDRIIQFFDKQMKGK